MWNRILEGTVAGLMAITVVIGAAAVFARYVVGHSLGWSFEALQALLVAMTFISAYLAMRRAAHLKIDVVVRRLPLAGQATVFLFNQLVVAGVGAVMMIWGAEQALRFWSRESLVLEFPLGPLYGIIPLSGLGIMIEALIAIPRGLRRVRGGHPPDDDAGGFALDGDEKQAR